MGIILFIVFSCFVYLSCIELCILLCRLVFFISFLAKALAGKATVVIHVSFVLKGFSYKDQIEECFVVMV